MSRAKISAPLRASGLPSSSSFWASPSTIAVLPTPGSPTNTGLFFRRRHSTSSARPISRTRPITGSSFPSRARSVRLEAKAASGSREGPAPSSPSPAGVPPASPPLAGPVPGRRLAHAVGDEVEDVEPGHALPGEDLHRVGARLAHERRQHVPDPGLVLAGALHVDDGGLQDPAEGERLLRRAARARGQLLHRLLQELGELVAQARHVGPRRLQDLLAVGVVGGGEEEVLHGQVGVPPHHGLPGRHVEHALQGRVEHLQASSIPARRGNPSA